ncbi:hypothetical protein [Niveibacterium sp. SC-1]|uniref:hypothetical protein n=1 Tax=Niveibacterium sp. SC-1 TaxID=3135646 RepID=UPI00311FDF27
MERNFVKSSPLVTTMAALSAIGVGGWLMALILSRPAPYVADTEEGSSLEADLATPNSDHH